MSFAWSQTITEEIPNLNEMLKCNFVLFSAILYILALVDIIVLF